MEQYVTGSDACAISIATKEIKFSISNNYGDADNDIFICDNRKEMDECIAEHNENKNNFSLIGTIEGTVSVLQYDTDEYDEKNIIVTLTGKYNIFVKKVVEMYRRPTVIFLNVDYK